MTSSTSRNATHRVGSRRSGARPSVRAAGAVTALLIAGDQGQAEAYGLRLRQDGYTVATAAGLERGLEAAAKARPDLVFVCLGSWAVPALVLLVLRSDRATRGVPVVLVSDRPRGQLAAEVGGLWPNENVLPPASAVHVADARRTSDHRDRAGCGVTWDRRLAMP